MPRELDVGAAVDLIVEVAAAHAGETVWIGVDGRGAAGKSTFAARLAAESGRVHVVHVDDFAGPRVPTWDHDRFERQVAAPLRDGRPARYQRWDWELDEAAEWHDIAAGSVVVVEGVSATRADVSVPWAVRVWVDAPRAVRLRRALDRDGASMMGRWLDDWMPSEEAYIACEHPQRSADIWIDGSVEALGPHPHDGGI